MDSSLATCRHRAVLIMGHSFGKRLDKWLLKMNLSRIVAGREVEFVCRGGMKLAELNSKMRLAVSPRRHICVMLEIGSNDLSEAAITAEEVATKIFESGKRLRDELGIEHVILFEVLKRGQACRDSRWMEVSVEEYNSRVCTVNDRLKEMWQCT
jgi:hypothetical protein